MAENKNQSNDPILNLLLKTYRFSLKAIWAILKFSAIILKDIVVGTPVVFKKAKDMVKYLRSRFSNREKAEVPKTKAIFVREKNKAGQIINVALYNNAIEAYKDLGKDFMSAYKTDSVIPDHTIQMFEMSYSEKDLDEIRKEIAEDNLRNYDDFDKLEGVKELHNGDLITEYFKYEQGFAPFSQLDNDGLFMYDIYINRQNELIEIKSWEEKTAKGEFSSEEILNAIEGRANISINDFAEILNNHPKQFSDFLNNEYAVTFLDAIAHYPDISRMGSMNVDVIDSLKIEHIKPINILVLHLISKTEKNPALATKARQVLNRIEVEKEWKAHDKNIFETKYDDNICTALIKRYSDAKCNSVLRAMMGTTYLKTLDDRNISQRGLFQQQVEEFSRTDLVKEVMRQFDEGMLNPKQYNLPLYFGALQRLSSLSNQFSAIRSQMEMQGSYKADLFGENEQIIALRREIDKYANVIKQCNQSFEVQTLDTQKIRNIRTAISSGKAIDMEGNIKPEILRAANWILQKYGDNIGVVAQIQEIMEGIPLKMPEYSDTVIVEQETVEQDTTKEKVPEKIKESKENDWQHTTSDEEEITNPPVLENNNEVEVEDDKTVGKSLISGIKEWGIETFTSSVEIIKSYANKFIQAYPDISPLNPERLQMGTLSSFDPEHKKNLALCLAGMSLGYVNGDYSADELLTCGGFKQEEINGMSSQELDKTAANIADYWMNAIEGKEQALEINEQGVESAYAMNPPDEEIDWKAVTPKLKL